MEEIKLSSLDNELKPNNTFNGIFYSVFLVCYSLSLIVAQQKNTVKRPLTRRYDAKSM